MKESKTKKADDARLLKILLKLGALFCLSAGLVQFFFPGVDAVLAEVAPGELNWIYRLLGSFYIGLGIGMIRVDRDPAGQDIFITTLIAIASLACLAFTISLFTEFYPAIPGVLLAWIVVLTLLLTARKKAQDLLTMKSQTPES